LFLFLFSCSSKQSKYSKLNFSEKDITDLIEQGYGDYLDSVGRKKEIYYKFAVLEDTFEMKGMINDLEEKYNGLFLFETRYYGNSPIFESTIISNSKFKDFKILNSNDINLIWKEFKNKQPNFKTSRAISKPFRPDSSDFAVIQEFKYPPITIDCMPRRRRDIFFKKIKNKWILIK
jgi:hypothetical protein